jgi:hypothetical protein
MMQSRFEHVEQVIILVLQVSMNGKGAQIRTLNHIRQSTINE